MASTSTPKLGDCRTSSGISSARPAAVSSTVSPSRPLRLADAHDDACLVEGQVGGVEEEDLPDLRLERVEPEAAIADRCVPSGTVTFISTLSAPLRSVRRFVSSSPERSVRRLG